MSKIDKRPEEQYRGDVEDQDKGNGDILQFEGGYIRPFGGTIKNKYQELGNGEGPDGVISGKI